MSAFELSLTIYSPREWKQRHFPENVRRPKSRLSLGFFYRSASIGKNKNVREKPVLHFKEGSHYDLPIALGLMAAIEAIPADALQGFTVLGELGLDGSIAPVAGVLPAAIAANAREDGLICPAACGPEAAWAGAEIAIVAAASLIQIANHFKGTQVLSRPQPQMHELSAPMLDLRDIKGQESAKRALEVAAAGGHHLLILCSIKPRKPQ